MTNYTQWKSLVDLHEYSAIPDSEVLRPREDDLDHFAGDTGGYDINDDQPLFDAELSLKVTDTSEPEIRSTTGLNRYPDAGETTEVHVYPSSDETNDDGTFGVWWSASDDAVNSADGYGFRSQRGDLRVTKRDNGSFTELGSQDNVFTAGEWHRVNITHASNGDITVTVYDTTDTQQGQVSVNDSQFITDGSFDNQGILINEFLGVDGHAFADWDVVE